MFAFTLSIAIVAISAVVFGIVLFRPRPLAGEPHSTRRLNDLDATPTDPHQEIVTAYDLRPSTWQRIRAGLVFLMSIVGIGGLIGTTCAAAVVLAIFILM